MSRCDPSSPRWRAIGLRRATRGWCCRKPASATAREFPMRRRARRDAADRGQRLPLLPSSLHSRLQLRRAADRECVVASAKRFPYALIMALGAAQLVAWSAFYYVFVALMGPMGAELG